MRKDAPMDLLSGTQQESAVAWRDHGIDDESTLLGMVRESSRSVAVYDIYRPAILAVSRLASTQLGFADVELADVDIVDAARDPESVRRLLALIGDGLLTEWKVRSWLRTPDGGGSSDFFGTGRAIDVGARRYGLVSYPSPIATTPDAADVISLIHRGPAPPAMPELASLSSRELEIATRLLRGERVPTIARSLYLSPSTVRNHLSRIYRKVGVHSQVGLLELLHGAYERTGAKIWE